MAKGNRPVTYETITRRFHAASDAADEARKAHEKAKVAERVAMVDYGEGSAEHKAATEARRAALRDLKAKNKAAHEAGRNLSKYADRPTSEQRSDRRYKYNKEREKKYGEK